MFIRAASIYSVYLVPYGDHVCLNMCRNITMSLRFLFPSPMGIMSVSIQMSKVIEGAASKVSVPYGDHVCLNLKAAKYGLHVRVSVPYGDHVCLNADTFRPQFTVSFRPLWGSCLSQSLSMMTASWCGNSFRPLWGSCLSQLSPASSLRRPSKVSVPYGDHVCLNRNGTMGKKKKQKFPSPMGIMSVSIKRVLHR